jgi:hypothetical protein
MQRRAEMDELAPGLIRLARVGNISPKKRLMKINYSFNPDFRFPSEPPI